jgi:predicted HicB family RNase H-like nuclease
MVNKYAFNIAWSEEDQEYVATCPAFPGLSGLGESEEKALAEAKVALGLFIQTCREKGIALPEEQFADGYSGQFRVRLPKSLHRQAAQLASTDGISLNQLVISAVEQRVGAKQVGMRMLSELKQALAQHSSQLNVVVASALSSNKHLTSREVINTETSSTRTEKTVMVSHRAKDSLGRGN